ncbi:signal transduction histidine kinase [Amycolatopsis sulphurea]|uniref:Signal transduction histidine kinase n=1 Tax=Amycolatopsis sulphurea TaxID=76022 RepID=A0A2A9F560_9PSEU|nr:ATP-binding protein [Amycolatopsis sulphurea]PFG46454.1 signal transduction histidine kinase [Amycolatopsis sulphurea]
MPDSAGPGREFVRKLLHHGTPREPSDHEDATATLARAARYWVVVPTGYRIAQFAKAFIGFVASNGSVGLAVALATTVVALVANSGQLWWFLRSRGLPAHQTTRVLSLDLAAGVLLNVTVAVLAPAAVQPFAIDLAWTWMIGTVAMWAGTRGLPTALLLLAAALPFRAVLSLIGGRAFDEPVALSRSVGDLIGLAVAIVITFVVLILLGTGSRVAFDFGLRSGREAERRRTQRLLHDSVLQSLEAFGLPAPDDEERAATRLGELRRAARAEAAGLRRTITEPVQPGPNRGFVVELANVAAEMAREGLRTQLVTADFADDRLSAERRTALREAVREALRNTAKHSGTGQVVLRVEERDGGITVVARDQGRGFDPGGQAPGFGISQSIEARLTEVGGTGRVESAPGRGTRVTLWVPH